MNLLAIETATSVCGVALFLESKWIDMEEAVLYREHAEKLPIFLETLMERQAVGLLDLDGIAISIGPGSFTGLRIGLSYAKGLAFSAGLSIVPVPTLQAMALGSGVRNGVLRCILHSHRDFVYRQDFRMRSSFPEQMGSPTSDRWEKALDSTPPSTTICQYGCDELTDDGPFTGRFTLVPPSVKHVGDIAVRNFDSLKRADFYELEPAYISHFRIGKGASSPYGKG